MSNVRKVVCPACRGVGYPEFTDGAGEVRRTVEQCKFCLGRGRCSETKAERKCRHCNGQGQAGCRVCEGHGEAIETETDCLSCEGSGVVVAGKRLVPATARTDAYEVYDKRPCGACVGKGRVLTQRPMNLRERLDRLRKEEVEFD